MITNQQKEKIELEKKIITDNISLVIHNIVIFSGKGGVGKTSRKNEYLFFSCHPN